jgi:hypothetical protein
VFGGTNAAYLECILYVASIFFFFFFIRPFNRPQKKGFGFIGCFLHLEVMLQYSVKKGFGFIGCFFQDLLDLFLFNGSKHSQKFQALLTISQKKYRSMMKQYHAALAFFNFVYRIICN